MDISELLPVVLALLVTALSVLAFRNSGRIRAKLARTAVLVLTGLLGALSLLMAVALIFFAHNYTRHLPPQISPDGSHIAITSYTVNNGTGVDQAEVAVRHAWSPYSHRVYAGPAQYQPNAVSQDPQAHWLDSAHLEIRFKTYVSTVNSPDLTPQGCAAQVDGITILCEETRVHAIQ